MIFTSPVQLRCLLRQAFHLLNLRLPLLTVFVFLAKIPLVTCHIAIENCHSFTGKLTISMAILNSYVANYQRVQFPTFLIHKIDDHQQYILTYLNPSPLCFPNYHYLMVGKL